MNIWKNASFLPETYIFRRLYDIGQRFYPTEEPSDIQMPDIWTSKAKCHLCSRSGQIHLNVISDSYIDQFSELLRNDKFKGKKMKGLELETFTINCSNYKYVLCCHLLEGVFIFELQY